MINIRIKNDDHEVDIRFPISESELYYADVFAGDNPLAENLPIKIKSEGMGSNKKSIL